MRVYSQSQGKFIEVGGNTPSVPTQQVQSGTGDVNTERLAALNNIFAGLIAKNPKQVTALNAIYEKIKPKEETAAEASKRVAKEEADRVISQLEDFYFKNKLYYGNNAKGFIANTPVQQMIDPNSPAAKYKSMLESNGAFLAKAAGDSGNVALQEQILSRKPFPTTRFTKTSAEENFNEIRKKFGLPERNYDSVSSENSGLSAIGDRYGL